MAEAEGEAFERVAGRRLKEWKIRRAAGGDCTTDRRTFARVTGDLLTRRNVFLKLKERNVWLCDGKYDQTIGNGFIDTRKKTFKV